MSCGHERRQNDPDFPGRKVICGRNPTGIFETTNTLCPMSMELCSIHLRAEIKRGRTFRTVRQLPDGRKRRPKATR